jgi:LCP family protein required for cell wall assembly
LPEHYTGPGLFKRFLLGALVIIVSTASATAVAGWHEVDKVVQAFQDTRQIPNLTGVIDAADAGEPQTILLMGSDKRSRNSSDVRRGLIGKPLSDTMILMRLDPKKAATALLSMPRDLKVEIPGHGRDKLNAAYSIGGARLTVRTIRGLDRRLKINHVINVDFHGFSKAVNALGCIYVDIDRRYYNQGNSYAKIDIAPGYQRLCGQDALSYVRYRHYDNDLIRAARQQDFLRQVKQQVTAFGLLTKRNKLLRIFSRYTSSDLNSRSGILRLLRLALASASHPIQEVHFRGKVGLSYVYVRQSVMAKTVTQFLGVKASKGPSASVEPTSKRARRKNRFQNARLEDARGFGKEQALLAVNERPKVFPIWYPTRRILGATFGGPPRVYQIESRDGKRYSSYRMSIKKGLVGEYYGLQGTTFKDAPILKSPSDTWRKRGRTFEIHYDGSRIRLISWKSSNGVFWITNTLGLTISNSQMRAIAASTRHL